LILDNRPLKTIIDNAAITGWTNYFIHSPKCIKYCNQRMIKVNNDQEVILLSQSQMNHYHADLYSYALWLKLEEAGAIIFLPFKSPMYYNQVKSSNESPCIRLKNWAYKQSMYAVEIYSGVKEDKFRIEFLNEDQMEIDDDIAQILADNSFIRKDLHYIIYMKDDKIIAALNELCSSFQKL
jgi:hypothetical protein